MVNPSDRQRAIARSRRNNRCHHAGWAGPAGLTDYNAKPYHHWIDDTPSDKYEAAGPDDDLQAVEGRERE